MPSARPRSGRQTTLVSGPYRAEIASVGASLRTLTYAGRHLVAPFAADAVRPVYRGAILVPWPNRVGGGRYRFAGREHDLPLTEPDRGNALHGLACWADWAPVASTDPGAGGPPVDRAVLEHRIVPQAGYPFDLAVTVTYALDDEGLHCRVRSENLGEDPAPYGVGSHAYLVAGDGRVDDWLLDLPADEVLEVDPDTLLPLRRSAVDSASLATLDFRIPHRIGATEIDHAYTAVKATAGGSPGLAEVTVTSADGHGAGIRWSPSDLPWVQVHTADRPEPHLHRSGLAVEPMTCPPNAFVTGDHLVVLRPGESHEASWTLFAL